MKKYFITGIGTDVGKTVASAIVVEALKADYWKPVQAGELHHSDLDNVRELISNEISFIHGNSYALNTPMSPHAAAVIDDLKIELNEITEPNTENDLVIEGAGGILVPLNDTDTILDLVKDDYKIIIVSKHYLGSINHTLLTISELRHRGLKIAGVIFNGDENKSSEEIIEKQGKINVIGRLAQEDYLSKEIVRKYAKRFKAQIDLL